jgi:hypothetical protein
LAHLCGFLPSLAVIFVALSPHPKIPFLVDKAGWQEYGVCAVGAGLSVLAHFSLFGFSPSLAVFFAALSLHPKIPFLADKYGDRRGDFGTGKIVVIAAD